MSNTTYITKIGDTWTGVAFKAYGDVTRAKDIIETNPYVPMYEVFDQGITLLIPIVDKPSVNINNIPPWKR